MTAGSTAAFFGAIDLAGAYPVALLWGVAPPLMALRLQRGPRGRSLRRRLGPYSLAALAAAFVAANAVGDLRCLLPSEWGGRATGARWQ